MTAMSRARSADASASTTAVWPAADRRPRPRLIEYPQAAPGELEPLVPHERRQSPSVPCRVRHGDVAVITITTTSVPPTFFTYSATTAGSAAKNPSPETISPKPYPTNRPYTPD